MRYCDEHCACGRRCYHRPGHDGPHECAKCYFTPINREDAA